MNKFLRQELKSWNFLLWFVFIAIGAQYFMRVPQSSREATVATINGAKLTAHELQRGIVQEKAMKDILARYLGQQFPVNPDEVLKNMVQQEVVGYHAYQIGARLSDDVISQQLFNKLPSFVMQKDGTVNTAAYGEYVRSQGFTVAEFEKTEEKRLLQSFLHNALYTSVVMPDWFLKSEWHKRSDKKKYSIGTILHSSTKKEMNTDEISDDQLRSYFEGRQEMYRIPEKRSIQYAEISFKEYAARSNFSEEEIKSFYERYKGRYFSTAPDASIREIFISSQGNEKAEQQLLDLQSKLKKDPTLFSDFAQKHARNDEMSKKIGFVESVKKGEVAEGIRRAALRLKEKGEMSKVLKLYDGYALIQLEHRVDPVTHSLHEARKEVIRRLQEGQSSRKLSSQIRQIVRASKDEPSVLFDKMSEFEASWKKTTLTRDDSNQEEIEAKLIEGVFGKSLQVGSIHFVQGKESVFVFKIEEIDNSEIPLFKKIRSAVLDDYTRDEVHNRTKQKIEAIQQKVLDGAALKDMDCVVAETKFMDKVTLEEALKKHNEYSKNMILLKDKSQVLKHHDEHGYYLIQLIDREENSDYPQSLEEQKKEFSVHYEAYKEIWLGIFIAYLEKNATIVYNTQILQ